MLSVFAATSSAISAKTLQAGKMRLSPTISPSPVINPTRAHMPMRTAIIGAVTIAVHNIE